MNITIPADELFEKGIAFLDSNNALSALSCFEKAYVLKKSPLIQSYLGLCIATERGKISDALQLCLGSVSQEPENVLHYLNLGKVYLKADRRTEALKVLRKGLSHGDNAQIRALLERVGIRRKAVFSFLPRRHFLNRYAGLLLSRFRSR